MKTLLNKIVVVALFIVTAASPSLAQTQGSSFFVKIDGIQGESPADGHKDEIDVFSFNLGVTQAGGNEVGAGAGAGKSQFQPVMIYKNVDVASPALFLACATGQRIKKVELKAARRNGDSGPQEYLTITLTDVIVAGFNDQSANGDGSQTILESISLKYAKIEISYRKQNPDGTLGDPVKAGFDLKANKKI